MFYSYDLKTGLSRSVHILNVYKPRSVRIGSFNGWLEEGSRNFGFNYADEAERFLTACGYARIPELQGVETLPNGVNAFYMWRHPNGSYATLHIVILKSK